MASPLPPDFPRFIAALARALELEGVPFMLIGGQAVLLHGRPRLTEDIDVTLGVDPSRLASVQHVCTALGLTPLPTNVEAFVQETYVLPARHAEQAIRVDFIFSTTPYERQAIDRADRIVLDGVPVPFAAAEDLIIHKLFAHRPRDMEDVRGVVRRKGHVLDWHYLDTWAQIFAEVPGREGMPDEMSQLRRDLPSSSHSTETEEGRGRP